LEAPSHQKRIVGVSFGIPNQFLLAQLEGWALPLNLSEQRPQAMVGAGSLPMAALSQTAPGCGKPNQRIADSWRWSLPPSAANDFFPLQCAPTAVFAPERFRGFACLGSCKKIV